MEDIAELPGRVERVVLGLAVPTDPVDGDCLIWEPRVTAALRGAGWQADGVVVIGWLDRGARVLTYVHRATLLAGHLVIDATARQFNPGLPACG